MLSPRYFIGNGKQLGSVFAANARTFKELVDRYLNIAVPLSFSREDFAAMDETTRKLAKRVNYLVPAVFRTTPSRRIYEQAKECNLIAIDLDVEENGHCPAAAFVSAPGTLSSALHPYSYAAYTTASSTPAAPRMRIFVEADAIPLKDYAAAVRTIFHLLGITKVTKESLVAIQPMFLPSIFRGDDPDTLHPLIAARCNGTAFTVGDIKALEAQNDFHKPLPVMGMDALDFLRPAMPEITLEIAKGALDALDPDITYNEWIEVAAALKHQFTPKQEDEAYALFLAWSAKGKKFAGEEEAEAKWKSLRPSPVGRVPVTVRTLLRRATAAGWSNHEVKDVCFKALLKWMETGARTSSSLLAEGIGRIASTPLLSQGEEDALLHHIASEVRRRFGLRITVSKLARDLTQVKRDIAKRRAEEHEGTNPVWTNGLVYLSRSNEFCRHATNEFLIPDALNATYGKMLLPTEAQLREAQMPATMANLSRPLVQPSQYLLNNIKIPVVYDTTYDPSSPDELFTVENGSAKLNSYVRSHPIADAEQGMYAGNFFRRHLEAIIAEPEYQRIILDFFAFLVQNPGRKIRWMILLQGAQGCGKSAIIDVMRIVLGPQHVRVVDSATLATQYNDWCFGAQLLAIEEIRVSGMNRHEVMNALKPIVTNDNLIINQKFKDTRQVINRANLIALTNYKDAIVIDETDRRNCIIQCKIQTKAQVQALGEDYFKDLYSMMQECPGGLRWFFENWKISETFDSDGHAPSTIYLSQLLDDSASEAVAAVRQMIREGDHPLIQRDLVSSKVILELLISREQINRMTHQQLAKILRDHNYENQGRHLIQEERHYLWTKIGEYKSPLKPEHEARNRASLDASQLELL